jgi:hypothetical protein
MTVLWAALTCSGCAIWVCSVYLDIKKPVRGNWVKVLDAARKASMPVLLGIDSNSHSFLYEDRENRRGLEMEDIIVSYGLEVGNRGNVPTFTGAGQNGTINQSFIDVTLSMGLGQEVPDWCVDSLPSLSDHRNISFTLKFKVRSRSEKVTKWVEIMTRPTGQSSKRLLTQGA